MPLNRQLRFILMFLVIGGFNLIIVGIVFGLIYLTSEQNIDLNDYPILVLGFVLFFTSFMGGFIFLVIKLVRRPAVYDEAAKIGVPAMAQVVSLKQTGVKQSNPRRIEFAITVQVHSRSRPTYSATMFEFLKMDNVPAIGDTLTVLVHPEKPEIVALPSAQ